MNAMFSWTHHDFTTPEGIRAVKSEPGIVEVIESALLDEDSRPRTLPMAEGTLVILRGVNLNPGAGFDDMISIRVWATPDKVVSTGRRHLRSVEALRAEIEANTGPASGGEFVCALVTRLNNFLGEAVEALEQRLEEAESRIAETRKRFNRRHQSGQGHGAQHQQGGDLHRYPFADQQHNRSCQKRQHQHNFRRHGKNPSKGSVELMRKP